MMVTGKTYGQMDPLACTEGSGLPSLRDRLRSQGKFENPLCLFTGFTPVGRAPSLPKKRARLGIFQAFSEFNQDFQCLILILILYNIN